MPVHKSLRHPRILTTVAVFVLLVQLPGTASLADDKAAIRKTYIYCLAAVRQKNVKAFLNRIDTDSAAGTSLSALSRDELKKMLSEEAAQIPRKVIVTRILIEDDMAHVDATGELDGAAFVGEGGLRNDGESWKVPPVPKRYQSVDQFHALAHQGSLARTQFHPQRLCRRVDRRGFEITGQRVDTLPPAVGRRCSHR